jgi:hypothetical protein
MTYPTQEGPWTVKTLISSYLEWDLPRRILDYRETWSIDDERLPIPEYYLPFEPAALDHWPTVLTVQLSTQGFERIDYANGLNPVYRVSYSMRTYVWTKHDRPDGVTESRDRLTTVVRAALLDRPCFVKGTSHSGHALALDETSLREEYSDITYVKGERAVAGAYLAYTVTLDETLARADIANLDEINLSVDATGNRQADIEDDLVADVVTVTITD